jgi:hypothetical protein
MTVVSLVQPADGAPIAFPTPSAAALALGAATRAAKSAELLKRGFRFRAGVGPNGELRLLDGPTTSQLFDYFEFCFVAVVFSVQAIEAYCNYKIGLSLKNSLSVERQGQMQELSRDDVERQLSTDEKLADALPRVLGIASPKGRHEWEQYVHLRRLRDATVHIKSRDQWTLASRDFSESPYSWFVQKPPTEIPLPAISLIRYFAVEHEREWLDRAQTLLEA